jgi:AcrR family transcriptional regulator
MKRAPTSLLQTRQRRTQEERSGETRERLLQAAIEVLTDRGFGGLTMSEVSSRAGVSNGALVHHYRSKGLLVIAATEFAYDRAIESGRRSAAEASARRDPLAAFLRDSTFIYFGAHFIIASEVLYGVRTDAELMPQITAVMERYRATMNAVWLAVFADAGVPRDLATRILNLSLFIVRGMAINSIWSAERSGYDALLAEWTAMVEPLLAPYLAKPAARR